MKTLGVFLAILIASASVILGQNAIRVEVLNSGSETKTLFLPGFTCPGAIWEQTISNLANAGESHLVSYAGFNGISAVELPWYSKLKDELIEYIKTNNFTNLNIVGHSMGGNLAIDIAAALPDRVKNLVLVDAIPSMREIIMPGVPVEHIQYENPYSIQQLNMDNDQFRQMATMMAQNMTSNAEKVNTLVEWMVEANRKTYVYGYIDLLKFDQREILRQITANTLVLGASFPDENTTKSTFDKQYSNLSKKTVSIAPSSRHFIMFDQPQWFYDQLNNFLK
jgi:pimeloyl-ACP methyl ester carboxylesterase